MAQVSFGRAVVLTGPTGSGKTALGVELAERLGAEVIAMDSMTLYRGMDVGTAKPGPAERARVPHHLIDVIEPWESASVAWWLARATECAREIEARGKRVLFVGGTPLYLKALLYGLFRGPPADLELRRRLTDEAECEGASTLHARLTGVDPVAARRLHPNDTRRIVRALEVFQLTGRPMSSWQREWPDSAGESDAPERKPAAQPHCLCLSLPRAELYTGIDARVRVMIERGLLDEARALRGLARPLSREAAQAVGYKEAFDHLEGRLSLEETVVRIQTRSRHLAKRQLTWFRRLPVRQIRPGQLTNAVAHLTMG